MYAIEAKNLVKEYEQPVRGKGLRRIWPKMKRVRALSGVSFKIKEGDFVGYVGPNGCGKSTTIKILTGILTPNRGTAECIGFTPWKQRMKYTKHIGVVFGQKTLLQWDLAVMESLKLYKDIYELSWDDFNKRIKYFDKLLGISKLLDKRVRKLSMGERMRCEIVASLLHKPRIVFLDEPTIGLDVVAKEEVRHFLREINKREGTTILLTTHDMSDIEALCKHVIILDKGKKIYDGELEKLKEKYVWRKYVRLFYGMMRDKTLFEKVLKKCEVLEKKNHMVYFSFNSKKYKSAEIIGDLMKSVHALDLNVAEPELKEIISQIYRKGRA